MKKSIILIIIFSLITSSILLTVNVESNQNNEIEIGQIMGGLGSVQVEIKNIGENDATNIEWKISVTGGLLNNINRTSDGVVQLLKSEESKTITCNSLLGLGNIKIIVIINGFEKTVSGRILLFFVQIEPEISIEFKTVASGFTSPIACANAGDDTNRLFIADQTGKIFVIQNDTLLLDPFLDISDKLISLDTVYDERGLLGLAFHPDYRNNGRFFIHYSAPKNGEGINHESILSEFIVSSDNQNIANPLSEKIILRVDQPESNHNGGQLAFGPDGFLYFGLGDGGGAGDNHGDIGNGQNINTTLGSILRIDIDNGEPYGIPDDNPFVGRNGADEIYSWGFRNPWKFSFDIETDKLFAADVGQDEWEEIDIVEKGINYGWRIMEGNNPYDLLLADFLGIDIETLGKPIHEYNHDVGKSITGGYIYRGLLSDNMYGNYIFGDWSSSFARADGKIYYLEEIETDIWERHELTPDTPFNRFVLSFGEDEQGEIYVLSKSSLGPSGNTGDVRQIIFN